MQAMQRDLSPNIKTSQLPDIDNQNSLFWLIGQLLSKHKQWRLIDHYCGVQNNGLNKFWT